MRFLIFAFCLLPFALFAQEAALSAALPEVLVPASDPVSAWIAGQASAHPWLFALAALTGFLRWCLKPLLAVAHNYVANTATPEDDKLLARVEHSPAFRVGAFLLDWFASIKLVRPESFSSTTKLFAPLLLAGALAGGTGCASIHQTATSSVAPDGTESRTVTLRVTALGDAKQTIEKLATSSGKTVSAGATGAGQETTSDSLKTLLELLKAVAKP